MRGKVTRSRLRRLQSPNRFLVSRSSDVRKSGKENQGSAPEGVDRPDGGGGHDPAVEKTCQNVQTPPKKTA